MKCFFLILNITLYVQVVNCPFLKILQDYFGTRDVHLKTGTVRGYPAIDGDYYSFLGIPYAAPPIGRHRFKAPLPPDPWNHVFSAVQTAICPQLGMGQEHCLIINVFTPKRQNETLPVLFYIHGGGFQAGSGPTGGAELLVKQNMIVVTLNYRLGPLGFLCLGTHDAPGNAGLKDIVAALRWVKLNIEHFGGDPDQITAYGAYSGAAAVQLLILSNMGKGLFAKAIIDSGSALNVWAIDQKPIETAKKLAKLLHARDTSNVYRIFEAYQNASISNLTHLNHIYHKSLMDGTVGFAPCLERRLYGTEPFLTEDPLNTMIKKKYQPIPMLISFPASECAYIVKHIESKSVKWLSNNYHLYVPADLEFDSLEIKMAITNNIKKFYFANKTICDKRFPECTDYFNDVNILYGVLNSVSFFSRNNTVYLMEFSYVSQGSHRAEVSQLDIPKHLFEYYKMKSSNDKLISQRLVRLIGNFVKIGNPVPSITKYTPVSWPPADPDRMQYLHFDNKMEVLEDPYAERKTFWSQLYSKYRREILPVGH